MLLITIPDSEYYDDLNNRFHKVKGLTLQLEHSLVSLSKWESKWCKPFLHSNNKTTEEILDYVRCMTINTTQELSVYKALTTEQFNQVVAYINAPMTATTFTKEQTKGHNREIVTSELIYYWMVAQQIPFECQKWHLNRLLTLIRVCSIKNAPPRKMGKREIMSRNARLNEERRKQINTRG